MSALEVEPLEVKALASTRRFGAGDDLVGALLAALDDAGEQLRRGDIVCVASKVVSLVEGATSPLSSLDPAARRALAREHATTIVADAPQVLVTRTPHGFVAANGGIDTSNAPAGHALLLPEDPDASAERIRAAVRDRTGVDIGVVITDTFGRPWRLGQTDVALGIAGAPAFRDERGGLDLDGQRLQVTQAAVADEIAGAADLVRSKANGAAFVLVRGVAATTPNGRGADLVRALEEDLFPAGGPTAALRAIGSRRTIRRFDTGRAVPDDVLQASVAAACTAPAPHHSRPWRVVRLTDDTRAGLLDAMAERWRADLRGDGLDPERIERRIARSDEVLRAAPVLLAPFVVLDDAHLYPDERRRTAERDLFVLSGGAALQNLQIALAGHGLGAAWISSTAFCPGTVREALHLDPTWVPLGMLAVGWPAGDPPAPRPPADTATSLLLR